MSTRVINPSQIFTNCILKDNFHVVGLVTLVYEDYILLLVE